MRTDADGRHVDVGTWNQRINIIYVISFVMWLRVGLCAMWTWDMDGAARKAIYLFIMD